jgi:hypothetical protein
MLASWSTSIINLLGTVDKVVTFLGTGNAARIEVRNEGSKARNTTDFVFDNARNHPIERGEWPPAEPNGRLYSRHA